MEKSNLSNHRYIFVCGLHRSGTSVLFRSLRDHPEVSGFQATASPEDEGMHLQTVYPPSGHYGGGLARLAFILKLTSPNHLRWSQKQIAKNCFRSGVNIGI